MYIDVFGKLNGKIDSEFVINVNNITTIERVEIEDDSVDDIGEKDPAIVTLINGDKIEIDATDYTYEELREEIRDEENGIKMNSILVDLYHSEIFRNLIMLIKDL